MSIKSKSELLPVGALKANKKNPRKITDKEFDKLVESVSQFPELMQARPVIIDEDNVILAGHQRHKAVSKLGWTEVPVIRLTGLTDAQKDEVLIKDNLNNGDWDYDMLAKGFDTAWLRDVGMEAFKIGTPVDSIDLESDLEISESKGYSHPKISDAGYVKIEAVVSVDEKDAIFDVLNTIREQKDCSTGHALFLAVTNTTLQ